LRPGLVFVSLFAILIAVYVGLSDQLGLLTIFMVQAGIVILILAASIWWRTRKGS
jgi:hypothetical protein